MARFRVTIWSDNRDAMLDLVRQYRIAVIDHGLRSGGGRAYNTDALVDESQIPMLESKRYFVERHEDVDIGLLVGPSGTVMGPDAQLKTRTEPDTRR
jgi:hypothetical protein